MFVTAVTRWGQPLEVELPHLAQELGEQAYDLRLKLGGQLPAYVYRGPDLARAQDVLAILQRRGHGAVACDLHSVQSSETMLTPRGVHIEREWVAVERGATQDTLRYDDLLAVIHAMETAGVDGLEKTSERKVSLGRAALSGGLLWTKSTSGEKKIQSRDAEPVLYLIRRSGQDPILVRQHSIRLSGLFGPTPPTSVEGFQTLVAQLRQRAPDALYDNRLLVSKRKATIAGYAVNATTTTTSLSNASENDMAAHLIALAHLKGQL